MPKSILITGCSSGIGLCAAEMLQRRGYQVFAGARKASDVQKLREKGLESLQLDLSNSKSIELALTQVLQKTNGKLDALFNNAGFVMPGAVEDLSRAAIQAQFETNVFGTLELTNRVIPIMRQQGHGRIIQNVSILGLVSMPYRGAYCASKFALEALSNTLRQELRGTGIFVSIIEPGPIQSQLRKNACAQYDVTLKDKFSAHKEVYKKMEKFFFVSPDSRLALQPQAVVKKVLHALESDRPYTHYYVGFAAKLFGILRRVLPESAMDWIMARVIKAENK